MAANAADEAILSATYGDEDSSTAAAAAGGVALTGGSSISSQQEVGFLGGVQTEYGELVHTYVAPPMTGPQSGGPHPSFGELALLYGKDGLYVCHDSPLMWLEFMQIWVVQGTTLA